MLINQSLHMRALFIRAATLSFNHWNPSSYFQEKITVFYHIPYYAQNVKDWFCKGRMKKKRIFPESWMNSDVTVQLKAIADLAAALQGLKSNWYWKLYFALPTWLGEENIPSSHYIVPLLQFQCRNEPSQLRHTPILKGWFWEEKMSGVCK